MSPPSKRSRASTTKPRTTDDARDELEHDIERFDGLASAEARWLESIAPPDKNAADVRLEILLLNAIRCGYAPEEIVAIANPQSRRKAA